MIQVMSLNESWQSDKLRQRLDEIQRKMEKGFEQSSLYPELLKSKNGDPALPPSWYKTLSKVKTGILDILAVIGNIGQINDAQIIIDDLRPWRTSEYTDEDGMDVQCQVAGRLEITNDILNAEEFLHFFPKKNVNLTKS